MLMALVGADAFAAAPREETKKTIFADAFFVGGLENWTVEQHVPEGYSDFAIHDGALVLYDRGSRILPNIPALRNLSVSETFDAEWRFNRGLCSIQLYFAYDAETRKGPHLEIACNTNAVTVSLVKNGEVIARQTGAPFEAGPIDFELRVEGPDLRLPPGGGR
jgi:hypothetical protein